ADRLDNLPNLRFRAEEHRMMQDNSAGMRALALVQCPGFAESAGRSTNVQSPESLVHRDALGPDRLEEPFTRKTEARRLILKADLVERRLARHPIYEWSQSRHILQAFRQSSNHAGSVGVASIQFIHLR